MTCSTFAPESLDAELSLSELQSVSGGVGPAAFLPLVAPAAVLVGIIGGVGYLAYKAGKAIVKDNVAQNLDPNCAGGDSDCSGSNRLSYGGLTNKVEDPFGGAFTGKQ